MSKLLDKIVHLCILMGRLKKGAQGVTAVRFLKTGISPGGSKYSVNWRS